MPIGGKYKIRKKSITIEFQNIQEYSSQNHFI